MIIWTGTRPPWRYVPAVGALWPAPEPGARGSVERRKGKLLRAYWSKFATLVLREFGDASACGTFLDFILWVGTQAFHVVRFEVIEYFKQAFALNTLA